MKALYRSAMIYTIAGLFFGVFYREFTKLQGFTGKTMLSILHVHTLTLGLLFFLILMLMEKQFTLTAAKRFKGWFITYNIALVGTLASMLTRGDHSGAGHGHQRFKSYRRHLPYDDGRGPGVVPGDVEEEDLGVESRILKEKTLR